MNEKAVKPLWINKLSIGFGAARLIAVVLISYPESFDAQWQLSYAPLWIADFPITLLYWWLPIPVGEALIGPVWWFFLPQLALRLVNGLRVVFNKSK
jgi:hypothetical protein